MPQLGAIVIVMSVVSMATSATAALATETMTYTYDAKGRVTKVVHAGTINNGVAVEYSHDAADNRTRVKVSGAP